MKVDVLNMEGQKVSQVELPAAIFEAPINVDLMHQAYIRQMANARLGTHDTKLRGEVRRWWKKALEAKRYWPRSSGLAPAPRSGWVVVVFSRHTLANTLSACR